MTGAIQFKRVNLNKIFRQKQGVFPVFWAAYNTYLARFLNN